MINYGRQYLQRSSTENALQFIGEMKGGKKRDKDKGEVGTERR